MKCHYELLNIGRDANDDDIKKSYRKMALKYHPDKNPDQLEESTKQFRLVQQAYEVLSDPQERAWYDKHREAILRGGQGQGDSYEDDSLDVYQYFNSSVYSGFGDDEKGFYTVFRVVFDLIADEDRVYLDEKSDLNIPGFGDSKSSYEEVVGPFYAYWESYTTQKSYVWKEKYDTREGECRQIRRAMEQENKKLRDKARKERNEEVRALASFVRKRDKRVQAYKIKLEERAAEIARLTEEKKKKQKEERLKQFEKFKEAGWSAMDGLENDLAALDAHYASDEEGELDDDSSEEAVDQSESLEQDPGGEEEMLLDDLYCVACNKAFKNERAFENHENSKKHRENVNKLKTEMLEEDEQFSEDSPGDEADEEVLYEDLFCVVCDQLFSDEMALTSHVGSKKHRQNVRAFRGEPEEEEEEDETQAGETEQEAKPKLSKKQRRKQKRDQEEEEDLASEEQDTSQTSNPQEMQNGEVEKEKNKPNVHQQISIAVEDARRQLQPILRTAKAMRDPKSSMPPPKIVNDSLYIDGKRYGLDNLIELPDALKPERVSTPTKDGKTAFFGRNSPLSNHHPSTFKVNGEMYNCMEQYFMVKKADEFGDQETVIKLKQENNPVVMKGIGKSVKNFNRDHWMTVAEERIISGLTAKFSQNPSLKEFLLDTGNTVIIEASKDEVWGVGLTLQDKHLWEENKWTGQNLMGKFLMKVIQEATPNCADGVIKSEDATGPVTGVGLKGKETSATKSDSKSQPSKNSKEPMICNVCGGSFSTRNKLFTHIKEKKHALRVETNGQAAESVTETAAGKGKKKTKKGKR